MQYEIPTRGAEYPGRAILVGDRHHRINYLDYLYKEMDWKAYAEKLAKNNRTLLIAEKAMLEVIDPMPVAAALVLPLAFRMTIDELQIDAAERFQSYIPDELELHALGILDIHQRFQNLGALEKISLKIAPVWS